MRRRRMLIMLGLGLVLAGLTLFHPPRLPADPITTIDGGFVRIAPGGNDLTEIRFTSGYWSPNLPEMSGFTSDLTIRQGGAFPSIEVTEGEFRLISATDSTQMAVFQFPHTSAGWGALSHEGFFLPVELTENTIRGVDLSAFELIGLLDVEATGISIDRETNTVTVQDGAFATFELQAAVPEPASVLLALVGLGGLVWIWFTRQGRLLIA